MSNLIDSIPQWIPCDKRMPKYDEYVLATTAWGDVTIAERLKPEETFSSCGWFIHEGHTNAENEDVIAWMPLPEPYAEPKKWEWVPDKEIAREYIGDSVRIHYESWHCECCGCVVEQWYKPTYKFCPQCGAYMTRKEETE